MYAIAHVRGGNELGREWHEQAKGVNRHKVYEDVAGAAKFLSEAGYSSPDTLSVGGGSNGGLVTGVAVTRNPELFDAAVGDVKAANDAVRALDDAPLEELPLPLGRPC